MSSQRPPESQDPRRALASLPVPDPEAAAHSARLVEHIRAEIETSDGFLPFEHYMDLALYAPGQGYYVAGTRKFGAAGDFVTAPETSALFGWCLARQCAEVLNHLGGGVVLEFGAGSGRLAADVLDELSRLNAVPESYLILEPSPELRVRQQETLGRHALAGRVRWLDRLPEGLRGVIIANEVLDAMPVQRFRIQDGVVQELGVVWNGEHFVWQARAAVAEMEGSVRALEQAIGERLPEGYESELHPAYGPWLASMADVLEAGVALLIDYGYPRQEYYRPERSRGTLMCHYRHRAHEDPFLLVGLQDITSYVDFTAVAEAGEAVGLWPAGYTTQAHFLLATGLDAMLSEAAGGDETQYLRLTREAKLLTLPGEMGERFQVLALSRRYEQPLSGFGLRDLLWRLG